MGRPKSVYLPKLLKERNNDSKGICRHIINSNSEISTKNLINLLTNSRLSEVIIIDLYSNVLHLLVINPINIERTDEKYKNTFNLVDRGGYRFDHPKLYIVIVAIQINPFNTKGLVRK